VLLLAAVGQLPCPVLSRGCQLAVQSQGSLPIAAPMLVGGSKNLLGITV
jgi:hypothetical protein